ncbi:GDP-mannose 4,6-dehydratase [Lysinibacillus pakistanensis]|uniref:GDP-mannose 4,6-dehydratase n=1 Tax=Lysinibacillus pakistanensis TaxID=759811 RepID=UPI003D28DB93
MKLLITGGYGFLGSNLAEYGLKNGIEIAIFDNLSRIGSVENKKWLDTLGKHKHYHGDIRNRNDVDYCIKDYKPDYVFHLAGQVAMTVSLANPILDFETNTIGTLNILESIRNNLPYTKLLYSSTNKVYGDLEQFTYKEGETRYTCVEHSDGFNENIGLNFCSPYGCSKGAAEQYILDYYRAYDIQSVVFRHSSMYGERQFASYNQGWVSWFCMQAILTKKNGNHVFDISGNGKQVRDLLFASDMVGLYYNTINNFQRASGEAFNIGGGIKQSLSLLELFSILECKLDTKLNYVKKEPRFSDQKVFIADIKKAEEYIGWSPTVSAEDGVELMLRWLDDALE